jgi:predicted regulator of Ras-like GTPase activity (Roadblock/LC7/MglB family)
MSTRMLNDILKALKDNGFLAGVFANADGLILAFAKSEKINEKVIGAMVALMTDAAGRTGEEMGFESMLSMKIRYQNATILCRRIMIEKSAFLLAAIANPAQNDQMDKYHENLMDWAMQNGIEPLKKLSSL